MNYYCAPLEGITDDLFRKIHHDYFPGVTQYYTPFLSPVTSGGGLTKRDLREVLPENNPGITLVPQVLTSSSEAFLRAANTLKELGYGEINLNLGCPSGTVCAKGKGAGFLSRREALEQFLDEIFAQCPISISIKTRLGKEDPEEFRALLALYRRYPIRELTVHPRVQKDLYRHPLRLAYLDLARREYPGALCLSGGIATRAQAQAVLSDRADLPAVMLGRGLIANPALIRQLQGGPGPDRSTLEAFHGALFEATAARLGNPRSTMFRMKEIWGYLILLFDHREKYQKTLRKTTSLTEYGAMVAHIFRELPLREDAEILWT